MPEHLRAFTVIVILAVLTFAIARNPSREMILTEDFTRRRNLWILLTSIAFITRNFWLYAFFASFALFFASKRDASPVALFFLLVFLLPPISVAIPGFGLVNYLFSLSHVRILALIILLPAFFTLLGQRDSLKPGKTVCDQVLLAYLVLQFVLSFREGSFFSVMRETLYLFLDIYLPFFVISRGLKSVREFREAIFNFVLGVVVLATIAFFEFSRHWLLYSALVDAIGIERTFTEYLGREGLLRATATTGQSIVLGYVMIVAIGLFLYLKDSLQRSFKRRLLALLLIGGLIAPLARGPWVGAFAMLVTYIAMGKFAFRRLALLASAGIMSLPLLSILPGGQKVLDLLPFIGNVERGSIDYRSQLIDNASIVIKRNFWFGSTDYLETPEMQEMRQGQGIIDLVNTYIQVALDTGFVGLTLFCAFFAFVLIGVFRAKRLCSRDDVEMAKLGQAILATLVGILVTIFTVSSISFIPIVYWSMAALGLAYMQLVRSEIAKKRAALAHADDAVKYV